MANETYNILQGIFNGQTPIQRSNPMSGQSNYYYMKPNQNSYTPLSQMQTVDVPSATTPNPYLREEESIPRNWKTAEDGKKVFDFVVKKEGIPTYNKQSPFEYIYSGVVAVPTIINNYLRLKNQKVSDKYKHAVINCSASQYGKGASDMGHIVSGLKEKYDLISGNNTYDESNGDDYANQIGDLMGTKYPNEDCYEIIQRYIDKKI